MKFTVLATLAASAACLRTSSQGMFQGTIARVNVGGMGIVLIGRFGERRIHGVLDSGQLPSRNRETRSNSGTMTV
jgi:hypothetical protein